MLDWILSLPSVVIIVGFSFFISLFSTLVYKFATDQDKMKKVHDERKRISSELKKNRDNPKKMMELNRKQMQITSEVFPMQMKSMLYTMIPLLLIFTWMNTHLAYEPLMPGEVFTTTMLFETNVPGSAELSVSEGLELVSDAKQDIIDKQVRWELKGQAGVHTLEYTYGNELYQQEVIVSEEGGYKKPTLEKQHKFLLLFPYGDGIPDDSNIRFISVDLKRTRPFGNLNIFGYYPGWFATYFITSIFFNSLIRKLLKVY